MSVFPHLLQNDVMEKLIAVAHAVAPPLPKGKRQEVLLERLGGIELPPTFLLPLNPAWRCKVRRGRRVRSLVPPQSLRSQYSAY